MSNQTHSLDYTPRVRERLRAAAARLRADGDDRVQTEIDRRLARTQGRFRPRLTDGFDTFCRNQRLRIMSQLGLSTPRSTSDTIRRDGHIETRGVVPRGTHQGEKHAGQA